MVAKPSELKLEQAVRYLFFLFGALSFALLWWQLGMNFRGLLVGLAVLYTAFCACVSLLGRKYSDEQWPVVLSILKEGDSLELMVEDKGMGIPIQNQARLFRTFHRAGNSRVVPGTGLGLNIARRAGDAHGGTIRFVSEEGIGTTFRVSLPLSQSS